MSTIIKTSIGIFIFAWAAVTQAAPFSLVDQSTGATYQCGTGTQGPTTPSLPNTACIQGLQSYCYSHSSQNNDQCFQLSMSERGCSIPGYLDCVSQTQTYCYSHSSLNNDQCFTQALTACRGGSLPTLLLDAVAAHAEKKASDKYKADLQVLKSKAGVN